MAATTETLAARILTASGSRAISDLYKAASLAKEMHRPDIAESLAEIAEAAQRQWLRRVEAVF